MTWQKGMEALTSGLDRLSPAALPVQEFPQATVGNNGRYDQYCGQQHS